MRVLVVTQHFAPEVTAASFRLGAFVEVLRERGHTVEVVCPVPNHPEGVVAPAYRGRPIFIEPASGSGGSVRRVAIFTRPTKSTRVRLATYASFTAAAALAGAAIRKADVVLASSPPLTVGAAGMLLAARHRCSLVFDVRDLWPESAVALGEVSEGRMLDAAERLERTIYARSRLIVTANDAFSRYVRALAPASAEVETVTNGTTEAWMRAGEATVPRSEVGLPEDRFVLAYAGNLGLAQAVEVAIEAIAELDDSFHLEIVGAGPRREELVETAQRLAPGRVGFRGLVEPSEAARILRAADALLVAERQDKTVSAKLYDYSALGRPIIAVAQGELESIVRRERIALHVPLGDPRGVRDAVARLRDDPNEARQLVARARRFAERHLRSAQAARLAAMIERL